MSALDLRAAGTCVFQVGLTGPWIWLAYETGLCSRKVSIVRGGVRFSQPPDALNHHA